MNNPKNIAAFIVGAGIGAMVAWSIAKHKYEPIIHEEFQPEEGCAQPNTADDIIKTEDYKSFDTEKPEKQSKGGNEHVCVSNKPYTIAPNKYGEKDDYELVSLTYYEDKLLADDNDELVEDIDNTVGFDSLTSFGEYEDDSVFVRNDRLKIDYEICKDLRKYMDVVNGTDSEE